MQAFTFALAWLIGRTIRITWLLSLMIAVVAFRSVVWIAPYALDGTTPRRRRSRRH